MRALVAVGQAPKRFFAAGSRSRASARSGGTVTSRGAVSSTSSTAASSPPATPACARFSALSDTMNAPPILATVLR